MRTMILITTTKYIQRKTHLIYCLIRINKIRTLMTFTRYSPNYIQSKFQGTLLTVPFRITITKRFMRKVYGHAKNVVQAADKSPLGTTATSVTNVPMNADKGVAEVELNSKLPTVPFFENHHNNSSNSTQETSQTSQMPTGYSGNSTSSSSNNTALLGTNSSTTRTTLNPENTKPVPYTDVRCYVTPPGEGYTAYRYDTTEKTEPNTGKKIKVPDVVDATGQEVPSHEGSHIIIRDNQTEKDVGLLTSNPKALYVAPHNVENQLKKDDSPKEQRMRIYDQPRSSVTACAAKEYPKGTNFLQKYDTVVDVHVVASGITDKPADKRVNRDAGELFHENGYPVYDEKGKLIEYDFNPNIYLKENNKDTNIEPSETEENKDEVD
jgi:hypothetical protein